MASFDFQKSISKYKGDIKKLLKDECISFGIDFSYIKVVFQAIIDDPSVSPEIKKAKSLEDYINKWVAKFAKGYSGRASQRKGTPLGTYHDGGLDVFITSVFEVSDAELEKFIEAHRFLMNQENKIGEFLEEYLAERLIKYGYYCAWGSTLKSIDFCGNGIFLQIKNSDNSENSSSSKVRDGTQIVKWFRRFSQKKDEFNWSKLNADLGIQPKDHLSEEDFRRFIAKAISQSPSIVHDNPESSWKKKI
jgi:hypothetical protein